MLDTAAPQMGARQHAQLRLMAKPHKLSARMVDLVAAKVSSPKMAETALPVVKLLVELAEKHTLGAAEIEQVAELLLSKMKDGQSEGDATTMMKDLLLDHVVAAQDSISMRTSHYAARNEMVTLSDRISDGILSRVSPGHEPTIGREFAHTNMADLARVVLQASGRQSPSSSAAAVEMALHSTGDFPAILGNVVGRTMLDGYEQSRSQLVRASREVTAMDFRSIHSLRVSSGPELKVVNEGGEFTNGTFEEGDESFALKTYGKVFGITRQALVNDDLGVFSNLAPIMGQGAAHTEAKLLAQLLEQNAGSGPSMKDGKALFHADHNNLGDGTAISVTALAAARTAMRRQKGLSGEAINVTPAFLVVPPELETVAEQLIAEITAAEASQVNPFAGRLTLLVDANLTDPAQWYLTAEPGRPDGLQHAYLDSQRGPQVFTQEGFEVDALRFKVRLDFGAGFVDHRAWYMNPGA